MASEGEPLRSHRTFVVGMEAPVVNAAAVAWRRVSRRRRSCPGAAHQRLVLFVRVLPRPAAAAEVPATIRRFNFK